MAIVAQEYIEVDDSGVAKLIGSRIKVRHVVMAGNRGRSVEMAREAYPHLSLAQIHAALSYYFDHQEEVDSEIAAGQRMIEEMRSSYVPPFTRAMLEERWRERFGTEPPSGEAE